MLNLSLMSKGIKINKKKPELAHVFKKVLIVNKKLPKVKK